MQADWELDWNIIIIKLTSNPLTPRYSVLVSINRHPVVILLLLTFYTVSIVSILCAGKRLTDMFSNLICLKRTTVFASLVFIFILWYSNLIRQTIASRCPLYWANYQVEIVAELHFIATSNSQFVYCWPSQK